MSKRRDLQLKLTVLDDLQTVTLAMKSLSLMETKKLVRCLAGQGASLRTLRAAASDFQAFYPLVSRIVPSKPMVLIAVGADRGFCGDFNQAIANEVLKQTSASHNENQIVIAVGERLYAKLRALEVACDLIPGAACVEEVPDVLSALVAKLVETVNLKISGLTNMKIIAHQESDSTISILEPIRDLQYAETKFNSPPCLTLDLLTFFRGLLEQYLEAVLYQVFYGSLLAENARRIMQLETAMQRLERKCLDLKRHYNEVRQEEITEEIEIIMMNVKQKLLPY